MTLLRQVGIEIRKISKHSALWIGLLALFLPLEIFTW
jgi:hypothetical protein